MTDPLNPLQRLRLAALYAVRDALHTEVESYDLPPLAHWVVTGTALPPASIPSDVGPDAAQWSPKVVES